MLRLNLGIVASQSKYLIKQKYIVPGLTAIRYQEISIKQKSKERELIEEPTQIPTALRNTIKYVSTEDTQQGSQQAFKQRMKFIIEIINQLKPYLIPFKSEDKEINGNLFKSYFYLISSKVCFFGIPFFLKHAIDNLSNPATVMNSIYLLFAFGSTTFLQAFFDNKRNTTVQKVIQKAWKNISMKSYIHLLNLDLSYHLQGTRSTSFSLNRARKGIESNLKFLSTYALPTLVEFVTSSIFLLLYCGPEFLATSLISIVAYFQFTRYASRKRRGYIAGVKNHEKIADFLVSEALANYTTVKLFTAEKNELNKYEKIINKYSAYFIINQKSLAFLNLGQKFIYATGLTVNLILGAIGVMKGYLTPGDVVLIQTLMIQIYSPLNNLGVIYREWLDSYYEIKELFRILETKPQIIESKDAKPLEIRQGNIRFENINFNYIDGKSLIQNLSLEIEGRTWVSIVGESGSGKSTLLNLLFRFYDVSSGRVLIDDQDIRDVTLESLRSQVGMVTQNPVLFNDTIINNLSYANPNVTLQDIQRVCQMLNLDNMISELDDKYESIVGEGGLKISGGERQRLSIARTILKNPSIILLDEATSALDSMNENKVLQYLNSVKNHKTIITVTHRLSINQLADKVIMICSDGTIEQGTHFELLNQPNSRYAAAWRSFILHEAEKQKDSKIEPQI